MLHFVHICTTFVLNQLVGTLALHGEWISSVVCTAAVAVTGVNR
jgi:hypothetical protein